MKAMLEKFPTSSPCNSRRELFAQELAAGHSATTAYAKAGYSPNYWNACRLKANERVKARVAKLQEAGAKRAEVTIASLVAELDEARTTALRLGQTSAAVAATMGKAKITGNLVDRTEIGDPGQFDKMTEAELRDFIAREAKLLGIKIDAAANK